MENNKLQKGDEYALQAHLAEYQCLREEIVLHATLQNQLASYAILIVAGTSSLFAIGQPSIAIQQPFLLLIASMLMSSITWASLDASFHANDAGKYIDLVLSPKIQQIIGNFDNDLYKVLRWESTRIHYHPIRLATKGVLGSGKFAVSYIPSLVFIVAFYATVPNLKSLGLVEQSLFWISVIMALVIPVSGIMNLAFILRVKEESPFFRTNVTRKDKKKE